MEKTLHEIADLTGGQVSGDGSIKVNGLANINMAKAGDLIFAVPPHLDAAKISDATAVLIPRDVEDFPKPAIKVADPRAAFAKLVELFTPKIKIPVEISPKAHIGRDVEISENVTIMPFAVVDEPLSTWICVCGVFSMLPGEFSTGSPARYSPPKNSEGIFAPETMKRYMVTRFSAICSLSGLTTLLDLFL